jgi:phenylalanine ammonia-lyase
VKPALNNGLPKDLASTNPSIDFGCKGISINMSSFMAELNSESGPICPFVISAEHDNQDVVSLALISALKSKRALNILFHLISCHIYSLLQAIDLRIMENKYREQILNSITDIVNVMFEGDMHNISSAKVQLKLLLDNISPYSYIFDSSCRYEILWVHLFPILNQNFNVSYQSVFRETLKKKLDIVLHHIKENGVSFDEFNSILGDTKYLYFFFRKTLGIKFNDAVRIPGTDLNKIYESLTNRQVLTMIAEILSTASP